MKSDSVTKKEGIKDLKDSLAKLTKD